jgi:hypothetical protein
LKLIFAGGICALIGCEECIGNEIEANIYFGNGISSYVLTIIPPLRWLFMNISPSAGVRTCYSHDSATSSSIVKVGCMQHVKVRFILM